MDTLGIEEQVRELCERNAPPFDEAAFSDRLRRKTNRSRKQASAPRRRSGQRVAVYASVAVVLVAALTVGTIEAVKHLGNNQPILVIGDEPTVTTETSQLYPVVVDGRLGYINRQGEMVIPPQFEDWPFSQFSEGLAPVSLGVGVGEKFGYIDTTGAWVIEPQFDGANPFSDGLAAVGGDNGLWGYIDKTGTVVIPMQYLQPAAFSEGLCTVMIDERLKGGKLQNEYIDKTGTVVIGPFEWSTSFSEGLAAVGFGEDDAVKWGFMDVTGTMVIQPQFDWVRDFSEGLAAVGFPANNDAARWGYIDKTGALVIEPRFDGADPFSEGLAPVVVGENDAARWGYIDKTGTVVIQPQFEWAAEFSEGLAAVGTNSGLFGYIDKTGTFVIPMEREAWGIGPFSGGLARFDPKTGDGSVSPTYLDKTGKVIWQGK